MKSVYSAVRTGSFNKAVCASSLITSQDDTLLCTILSTLTYVAIYASFYATYQAALP